MARARVKIRFRKDPGTYEVDYRDELERRTISWTQTSTALTGAPRTLVRYRARASGSIPASCTASLPIGGLQSPSNAAATCPGPRSGGLAGRA